MAEEKWGDGNGNGIMKMAGEGWGGEADFSTALPQDETVSSFGRADGLLFW